MLKIFSIFLRASTVILLLLTIPNCSQNQKNTATQNPRIVLLGIDAASWKVALPLIRQGKLPAFERLQQHGAAGALHTLYPTVSIVIWTTIATGKMPTKHGLFNWTMRSEDGRAGQLAISSTMRKTKAIWDIASEQQLKSLIVNWWATWPATPLKGLMLSNNLFFKKLPHRTHPDSLVSELDTADLTRYTPATPAGLSLNSRDMPVSDFLSKSLREELFLQEKGWELYKREQPDISAFYFRALDLLQHDRWDAVEPWKFADASKAISDRLIPTYYQFFDRSLNELINSTDQNTTFVIVSDHGMEALNQLPPPIEALNLDKLFEFLQLAHFDADKKVIWDQSRAIDNGRYPPGFTRGVKILASQEVKDTTTTDVKQTLAGIVTSSGKPLFTGVQPGNLPDDDLLLSINSEVGLNEELTSHGETMSMKKLVDFIIHPRAGQHWAAPNGIVLIAGQNIRSGVTLDTAHVQDITPTLLTLMGLPQARDMDGKPLIEILETPRSLNQLQWVDSYDEKNEPLKSHAKQSSVDETIKEELKSLGYITN